ncbi:hypothetical protein AB0C28_09505 [Nonomuraea sp. NPDC048892]|uniref:hypothetical protein n=1 Tax=Nonomuraea sp. NPDC048892 TaxID=3154624 RepID=UPI0033E231A6
MADESAVPVRAEHVSVDDEGRVTIADPQTAKALQELALQARLTPNPGHGGHVTNNCHGGNCSAGCAPK